jgi:hypothetical protein
MKESPVRWLVLAYQFPKGPDSRRVKIWRRLQRIGAVAIKNAVYVLPHSDQSREDLQWLLTELRATGADGAIFEASFVDGMTDQEVRNLFNEARAADYRKLREEVEDAIASVPETTGPDDGDQRESGRRALARARKRLGEIEAIDFFAAPGQDAVEKAMRTLAERAAVKTREGQKEERTMTASALQDLKGRVWVTRRGVRVDRMASAWLIRRWIDADAGFKFVSGTGYEPGKDELRFDMFEAEFTHNGDRCTFEVLARLARPDDSALRRIGEIVHDIDLKDAKFGRAETEGVATLLSGIAAATDDDERRIERGCSLFDDLYASFAGHRA